MNRERVPSYPAFCAAVGLDKYISADPLTSAANERIVRPGGNSMQWLGRRASDNVEDRRGMGRVPIIGGGLGLLVTFSKAIPLRSAMPISE